MTKISNVAFVNSIQLATYNDIAKRAVDGVISAEVCSEYKANVLNALVTAGAVKVYYNTRLKLTGASVELLVRKPNVRTLRRLEAEGMQLAA